MKLIKAFVSSLLLIIACSIIAEEASGNGNLERATGTYVQGISGYTNKVEVDYASGLVYYKTYYAGVMVSLDSIRTFNDYLQRKKGRYIRSLFLENYLQSAIQAEKESGLIGDIELPITFGKMSSFFGEGGKLKIEGSERVDFTGSKTFDRNLVETETGFNDFIPEFTPKQHLIVNVTGTVGDRIEVNLNHDSETEQESDNTVKIKYKGSEDDILQSVEAGDVDLSLPGIKLIGGTPEHKGLFGVKATGQLAGLKFTAIASKETGETQSQSFVGNTKQDSMILYDAEYSRNKFFLIGVSSEDTILELNVFKDDGIGTNNDEQGAVPGNLYYLPGTTDSVMFQGQFTLLTIGDANDYYFDRRGMFIEMINQLSTSEVLAVSYIVKRSSGDVDTIGTVDYTVGDTLRLKAIKQKDDGPGSLTWDYMMKNVYNFSGTNIISESFSLDIFKVNNSTGDDYEIENGKTYLSILGLDNNADGKVDLNYINFERGYIIFPALQPFADGALAEPDSIIYNTVETGSYIGRKYYLNVIYRGAQSTYSLGVFNILEGTEVVTVNSKVLTKDVDYIIDYEYGIINFLTDEVNAPNAEIKIDYQYSPFISISSKNLMGLHLEYNLSDKLIANSNWLYSTLSYQLDDYPRIGEEPQEALVGEMDISYKDKYLLISDIANLLPFYYSEQPADFTFTAKAGLSYPNPNSTGKAYVENMESILVETSISTDRKSWVFGSLPDGYDTLNLSHDYLWYNEKDLMGNINDQVPAEDLTDDVTVMNLIMSANALNPAMTFVSLNQSISRTGIDISDMKFLEVWVKGEDGQVFVDIGKNIKEDMVRRNAAGVCVGPDNVLQTEDKNNDGILDSDEDTGLDGVQGVDGTNTPGDDGNDDYVYDTQYPNDYSRINGTENNNIMDSEDLDRDGSLNANDDFYRFTIDLNSSYNRVYKNPSTGWSLYRIPLNDPSVGITGTPDLKYIKYARFVWTGASATDTLRLYKISVIANKWRNYTTLNSTEEKFYVGAKNNQTDPDYYPPFDPGYDTAGKLKREQSMVLYLENALHGEGGKVYKVLTVKDTYERYKDMSFYVRSTTNDSLTFYFKFGGDSLNYYYVKYTPTTEWAYLEFPLESLINLKLEHSDTTTYERGRFGFYGAPSLTNIGYLEFVVMNDGFTDVNTEIWVDDIMLKSPKRELGKAGDVTAELSVPSLLSLSGTASMRDPFFKQLNDNTGSGNNTTSYRYNASLSSEKLLPDALGVSIPVNYSYNRSRNVPLYNIGADYYMRADEVNQKSSVSNSKSGSVSLRRSKNFVNPALHYIFDNLMFSSSVSNQDNYNYSRTDTSSAYSVQGSYNLNLNLKPYKILSRMEFYPLPATYSMSMGYNSSASNVYSRDATGFVKTGTSENSGVTRSVSTSYKMFRSLNLSFSENRAYDNMFPGEGYLDFLGMETGKNHSITAQYNPLFIKYITHNLSLSTSYNESSNPRVITVADSAHITAFSNSGRASVGGNFDIPGILRWTSALRDESKDSTVITGSPQWFAIYLSKVADGLRPISYNYSKSVTSSYSYMSGRAPMYYQLGITDTVPTDMLSVNSIIRNGSSEGYNLSSGIQIASINLSGTYSFSSSITGYDENITENLNTRWPNLTLNIDNLEKLPLIKNLVAQLSLRSTYSVSTTSSGTPDSLPDRVTTTTDMSPVIGLSGLTKFKMNFSYNMSRNVSNSADYGTIETLRRSESVSHSASFGYAFSSPTGFQLPIIKKVIKFKSNLNTALDMSYTMSSDFDITNNNELSNRSIYSIGLRGDYNFSNNVTGGLNAGYTLSDNKKTGDKRDTVTAGFWVLFRF